MSSSPNDDDENPQPSTSTTSSDSPSLLGFAFRERRVPVTYHPSIPREHAEAAIQSDIFVNWYRKCEQQVGQRRMEIHSVEIQSVDMFGARGVGFVKIKSTCTLVDGEMHHKEHNLPGICFLRGNAVSIFVALHCSDDGMVHSLLVEQPRVPTGQVSALEVPAGMMDDTTSTVAGIAVQEMREECGINIQPADLVDLTQLAGLAGIAPSPGGCDERVRFLYLEKTVTSAELEQMKQRLTGLREHGEFIVLKVVPMQDVWKVSGDAKAMISLFLLQELRREGKLPPAGELATPLTEPKEPVVRLNTGATIPQLTFGLYKIPASEQGEQIILEAIAAGYRHFDSASIYGNETTLGNALKKSNIPRDEFFITSKVWNDAVKQGPAAVRASVEKSLSDVGCEYFDLFLVHWPVPGYFVEAYRELEKMHAEGKLRAIGISNFATKDYEELARDTTITPAVNQIEVSPVMYRKEYIDYFQSKGIVVCAHKALHRGGAFDRTQIANLANKHTVTPAQIMLRWGLQKGLAVTSKTSNSSRMRENRDITTFRLDDQDMALLDSLTTAQDIQEREELEEKRKTSL